MPTSTQKRRCRFCAAPLNHTFADLGVSPLANAYLNAEQLQRVEPFYPLYAYVCSNCYLVQLEELSRPAEIFSEYAYFSSFSDSWLAHARNFSVSAAQRLQLDGKSLVVEIGSNDGYLLRFFKEAGIPVLGIEPAENVAKSARDNGIETAVCFFDHKLAAELAAAGRQADLIVANNVLAHIPATNDLISGLKVLLKADGVVSIETPHLMALIEQNQFDTIYHEHYSYYSLTTLTKILAAHRLTVFDLEVLPTHGGSLRIYAGHAAEYEGGVGVNVKGFLEEERKNGICSLEVYEAFGAKIKKVKRDLLSGLIGLKEAGKSVAAYGAPAKGNTLLNYCGIGTDFIDYTVDRNPYKQGLFLPGSHIPIFSPAKITETRPDYLLILPWNLKEEIMGQMNVIREWGGRFMIPIPAYQVC